MKYNIPWNIFAYMSNWIFPSQTFIFYLCRFFKIFNICPYYIFITTNSVVNFSKNQVLTFLAFFRKSDKRKVVIRLSPYFKAYENSENTSIKFYSRFWRIYNRTFGCWNYFIKYKFKSFYLQKLSVYLRKNVELKNCNIFLNY